MNRIFLLLFSVLAFSVFHSCKDKAPSIIKVDPAFSAYISAFTSGVISTEGKIRVKLTDDFNTERKEGEKADETLISFEPNIEGTLTWLDSRTLEFTPSESLERGRTYNANLALDQITDVPSSMKNFAFQFHIMKQQAFAKLMEVKPYDNVNLRWQYVKGRVKTIDVALDSELPQTINLKQNGKKLPITWTHDLSHKMHYFTIDSLERTSKNQELELKFNQIDGSKEEKIMIEVPALGNFKIIQTEVIQQPEQYVLLRFSDPLLPKQNLDGLIKIGRYENTSYSIQDNELKIYPPIRISGTHMVELSPGLKNILSYSTKSNINLEISFEDIKPNIKITDNKIILPSTEGLSFAFDAVNLSAVDVKIIRIFEQNVHQFFQVNTFSSSRNLTRVGRVVRKKTVELDPSGKMDLGRWNTFNLDLDDIIKAEKGAIYRVELSFRKNHSLYECDDTEDEDNLTEIHEDWDSYSDSSDDNQWDYYGDYYYDDYYYDDYYYDYDDYLERESPCSNSYYQYRGAVSKNIFASDLGIIVKKGKDQSLFASVSNLISTELVQGAEISLYDFQQNLIAKKNTDNQGIVEFENLEKAPFLLVAKHGNEFGYIKMDNGSSLSLSKFDVGGSSIQKGLKGFIYGERGVWRPGDTLFLSFILEDEFKSLPANHPVSFQLKNPKGQIIHKTTKTIDQNGFYSFITPTNEEDLTGNWNASIRVGGATFNKRLKVETIKPNRLKIGIDFGKELISVNDDNLTGKIQVNWLHGAPARNLRASVGVTFTPISTRFDQRKEFHFDDPVRQFQTDENIVFDERISNEGFGEIDLNLDLNGKAPGFLKAYFNTKVFEEGGEFSVDRFSLPFAPYESFVGIKTPKSDGWWGMLETGKEHQMEIVSVDAEGNSIQRDSLEIKIFKINNRWWWSSHGEDLSRFEYSSGVDPIIQSKVSTNSKGEANFKFNIEDALWGRYLIRVVDPISKHATGKVIYFDWPGWRSRSERKNTEGETMLMFSSDKDTYNVGEECEITFPSSSGGKALISIENGTKVLESHWIDTQDEQTIFRFDISDEMTPNIFINTTLIQPHAQTINDMPIRMYGIIPIGVENSNTHLNPIIDMPKELRPEEKFTVKIKEQAGKKMTYTVAIVDDGLLDLTNFKTPDPWNYFYAKEALGVTSWDMYDQVIGAQGKDMKKLLSIGGDGTEDEKGKNKANRFKPVVLFAGPFTIEKGKSRTHEFTMPNYIGSVRTMVISGQDEAYGKAQETTPVKKPLMVLATLPRVVGPSENVKLPVSVFAMKENIRNVKVEVKSNEFFSSKGNLIQNIRFDKIGDQVINFDLKVKDKPGIGKIEVLVSSGSETASYEIEIDVRNPNPEMTEVIDGYMEENQEWSSSFDHIGMEGTNEVEIEVCNIPPIDFSRRLKYLIGYPHGCVEQTVSKAFPQLFLADIVDLSETAKNEARKNVQIAIDKLVHYQNSSGGLSYWRGGNDINEWGSSYAGHFLLEAKNQGYSMPNGFMSKWLKCQKNLAIEYRSGQKKNQHYYEYDDMVQAYRLYALALAGEPELGAMNRLKENKQLNIQTKWRLSAAYALAGQKEVAKKIVEDITTEIKPYNSLSYTYGSDTRDQAMIVETLCILDEKAKAAEIVREIAKKLSSYNWYSTQTTAYSLMAISKFSKVSQSGGLKFEYEINGQKFEAISSQKSIVNREIMNSKMTGNMVKVKNLSNGPLFVKLIQSGKPLIGYETSASNDLNMQVSYFDLNDNMIDPSKIEQGTDFKAVVSVSNPGYRGYYQELALSQVFPSGWEILNTRMDEIESIHTTDIPTYQDIRDDRVYSYFNIYRNKSKTYTVLLNASYLGKFYLPAVTCEAMYDKTIYAREKGHWVEVVPR